MRLKLPLNLLLATLGILCIAGCSKPYDPNMPSEPSTPSTETPAAAQPGSGTTGASNPGESGATAQPGNTQ